MGRWGYRGTFFKSFWNAFSTRCVFYPTYHCMCPEALCCIGINVPALWATNCFIKNVNDCAFHLSNMLLSSAMLILYVIIFGVVDMMLCLGSHIELHSASIREAQWPKLAPKHGARNYTPCHFQGPLVTGDHLSWGDLYQPILPHHFQTWWADHPLAVVTSCLGDEHWSRTNQAWL